MSEHSMLRDLALSPIHSAPRRWRRGVRADFPRLRTGDHLPFEHSRRVHVAFGLFKLANRCTDRAPAGPPLFSRRRDRPKGQVMAFSLKLTPKVEAALWGAVGGAAALA